MRKYLDFYLQNGDIENCLELLDMSEACMWMVDMNFKIMAYNKVYVAHMKEFVNKEPRVGDGDVILSCFPPAFADNIRSMYLRALNGEHVKSLENGFNTDGSSACVIMFFSPVTNDEGEMIGVRCMRKDISEYVRLKEELDAKEQKISEINWRQSHLIRGPLSTAMGVANLLKEEAFTKHMDEAECKAYLDALCLRLEELDGIVRTIVDA